MPMEQYAAFAIPNVLEVVEGRGGLPAVRISNRFAQAEIYLHGAHVTRFEPAGGKPLIWTSPSSPYAAGKSIRGGVPVCFPWFGPHRTVKEFPVHGFVRFRSTELLETAQLSDGRTRAVFGLAADDATRAYWPHEFRLEAAVTVGAELEIALTVANTGREPFSYEDCFHTYFAVGDATRSAVSGFDGSGYIDRLKGDSRGVQSGDVVPSTGEITNVYTLVPPRAAIEDAANGRRIAAEQSGLANAVVWNPGEATAAKNPEMAGMWKDFLCLEAANCLDTRIVLLPGCSHASRVRYRAEKK
jgi:glucose-6-phosphate 1-epimerase